MDYYGKCYYSPNASDFETYTLRPTPLLLQTYLLQKKLELSIIEVKKKMGSA